MIWTLQVKLLSGRWAEKEWMATIAVDAASTLEDLHLIIQQAVEFDNDHPYSFFVARTPWSRDRVFYDGEHGRVPWEVTLESLFPLPKGRKLFYLFDYGDNWRFQISRTRHKPFEASAGEKYPCLIDEYGEKPRQYPNPEFTVQLA